MSVLNSLNLYLFYQQTIKESLVAFISRRAYAEQEENALTPEGIVEVLLVGKPLPRRSTHLPGHFCSIKCTCERFLHPKGTIIENRMSFVF